MGLVEWMAAESYLVLAVACTHKTRIWFRFLTISFSIEALEKINGTINSKTQ